jgi:hypothetical protein
MKLELYIKPCPWCRETPKVSLPYSNETWQWKIKCLNGLCLMQPESPYVNIRKTQKTDLNHICFKVEKLVNKWNTNNPFPVKDKKIIDLAPLNLPPFMYV